LRSARTLARFFSVDHEQDEVALFEIGQDLGPFLLAQTGGLIQSGRVEQLDRTHAMNFLQGDLRVGGRPGRRIDDRGGLLGEQIHDAALARVHLAEDANMVSFHKHGS